MASSVPTLVRRQVTRVGRRLFLQTLLDSLVWCWVAALALAAGWFLLQPYILQANPEWLRWTVAGGLLGVGLLVAVVLAVIRAPSRLAAALSLDERFGLRERVTTSLTLAPGVEATPAGQALMADVGARVGKLDVGERFPVRVAWTAALVPVCAAALALLAVFYQPVIPVANASNGDDPTQSINVPPELQKKLEKLAKKPTEKTPDAVQERSKELKEIDAELEKLVNKPVGTKEQLQKLAKDLTDLESDVKRREKDLAQKSQALKEQLKNLDKMTKKDNDKKGPGKELEKALAQGDFEKAKEEAEKLAKKLQDGELTDKEKDELTKEIKDLKEKLEKLADKQEEEEKLKNLAREGKIDQETLEREMAALKKEKDSLKDLKEIAEQLEQAEQAMTEGNAEKAAQGMKKAGEKMKRMRGNKKELDELADKLQNIQDARRMAGETMDGRPVPGAGRRPESKEGDFTSRPSQANVDFDAKGRKEITDLVPGSAFKKKSSKEMAGEITQASQEAAEAKENQRVDRAAKEMYKGYFENLRKDAEKDLKK